MAVVEMTFLLSKPAHDVQEAFEILCALCGPDVTCVTVNAGDCVAAQTVHFALADETIHVETVKTPTDAVLMVSNHVQLYRGRTLQPRRCVCATSAALKAAVSENTYVFVKFSASWCAPCRALNKLLHHVLAVADASANLLVVDVDIDVYECEDARGSSFAVPDKLPTLRAFVHGEPVYIHSGTDTLNFLKLLRAATGGCIASKA